jgi:sulfonate transport system substrate-binding protein
MSTVSNPPVALGNPTEEWSVEMMSESRGRSYNGKLIFSVAAVVAALAIGGYFLMRSRARHTPVGPPEKVVIAYSATPDSALAQVAQTQGYFLQEGLDATPQRYPSGKVALDAVLEGKADIATVAETPVMLAIMHGRKLSIIATIQTSTGNNAIIARKDKGIIVPRELKGRKIAVTSGTSLDYFVDAFLAAQGIMRKDVTRVNMRPEKMAEAVERGEVDAISAWSYVVIQAQKRLGDKGITFYDEDLYTQTFNIVTTQDYVHAKPENIKKILRALIKAEKFVVQKPAEAQAIVADFSNMDKAIIGGLWAVQNFSVALDQSLVLAMEDESQWAIQVGLTDETKIPNYLDFIYFEGLDSVKPSASRILR